VVALSVLPVWLRDSVQSTTRKLWLRLERRLGRRGGDQKDSQLQPGNGIPPVRQDWDMDFGSVPGRPLEARQHDGPGLFEGSNWLPLTLMTRALRRTVTMLSRDASSVASTLSTPARDPKCWLMLRPLEADARQCF